MIFYNEKIFKRCFHFPKRYWYKNVSYIPLYFKLIHHLIKYGYDEYATWETFDWFISTMKSVLNRYRFQKHGTPIIIDVPSDKELNDKEIEILERQNEEEWDLILFEMEMWLNLMDEDSPEYDDLDELTKIDKMNKAKDEFFKLFSKYFYDLWD